MKVRKLLSLLLALALCVGLLGVSAGAAGNIVAVGGSNGIAWVFDSSGTLTVTSTGGDAVYNDDDWLDLAITRLVIGGGISTIEPYAFAALPDLCVVIIDEGLTEIGQCAFMSCEKLRFVSIPLSVTAIGAGAITSQSVIYYAGTPTQRTHISIGSSYLLDADWCYSSVMPDFAAFGACGDYLRWTMDDDGALVITGHGPMQDYYWSAGVACAPQVRTASVPAALSSFNPLFFADAVGLTEYTVDPESRYYTADDGVIYSADMTKLVACPPGKTSITIPDSVTAVLKNAFCACNALTEAHYSGTAESWAAVSIADGNSPLLNATLHFAQPEGPAIIASGECGTNLTWTLDEEGNLVISGSGGMISWTSPSNVPWYGSPIHTVTIQDGPASIGKYAFYGCTSLTEVRFSDSVANIGDYAFWGCTGLTEVTIPGSIIAISDSAFLKCSNLTAYHVSPYNPTYCSLDGVLYTKDMKTLVTCPNAKSAVSIPNGVTAIGNHAFSNCAALASVTLPGSVTTIGTYAFEDCTGLTEITIPDGVTFIGRSGFDGCTSLTFVTLPGSITAISDYAFCGCSSLTEINIPDSVTGIGIYAFINCSSLAAVTLPVSVTGIGLMAFYNCPSLTDVYYGGTEEQWSAVSVGNNNGPLLNATLHFAQPEGPAIVASGECGTNLTWTLDGDGNLVISGDGAMWGFHYSAAPWYACRSDILTVSLPEGLISIGDWAFLNCDNLTTVTIPDSVTFIGKGAFLNRSDLADDYATPVDLTYSPGYSALTDVYYGGTKAQWNAVDIAGGNGPLLNAAIHFVEPESPAIIASGECGDSLTWTLDVSGNLVISGSGAMDSFWTLAPWYDYRAYILTVSLPEGLTSIGARAFEGCTYLGAVTIPDSVSLIEDHAFCWCSNLTSIIIPGSVTAIGYEAFDGASSLSDITYIGRESQWNAITIWGGNAPLRNAALHCTEPEIIPVSFSLPTLDAYCGKTVTVPVNITDNPGLASVTLTVNYDPAVLEYTGAQFSSVFSALPGATSLVNPQDGKVTLTWVVTSGECDADGIFAELSFTVLADAAEGESPITIAYNPNNICDEALENVPAQAENGAVNVSRRLPGDVNGDDEVNNKDALLTLRYVAQFTVDADIDAMDVNADGSVDAKDALLLLRYAAGFDVVLQ